MRLHRTATVAAVVRHPEVTLDGFDEHLFGGLQREAEPGTEIGAGHFVADGAKLFGRIALLIAIALVGDLHGVVEGLGIIGGLADFGVEQEAHYLALGVVTDGSVGRVLVGPVELNPGVVGGRLGRRDVAA